MRLKVAAVARDRFDLDRKLKASRPLDLGRDLAGGRVERRIARNAGAEKEAIIVAVEASEPRRTLGRGQAIEYGDRRCDFVFERIEHDRSGGHVALEEQNGERHDMRDGETGQQDNEEPRPERARP
ncbi:hypothetical protein D9M72_473090 [compost metagenome]